MKAFKILIATVVLSAFTLTSCSKDDDNVQVPTSIVGKWNFSKEVTQVIVGTVASEESIVNYDGDEPGCERDFLEFNSAMTVRKGIYNKNISNVCTEESVEGTYTKASDVLTISLPQVEDYDGTFTITKLTSTEMNLEKRSIIGGSTLIVTQLLTKSAI